MLKAEEAYFLERYYSELGLAQMELRDLRNYLASQREVVDRFRARKERIDEKHIMRYLHASNIKSCNDLAMQISLKKLEIKQKQRELQVYYNKLKKKYDSKGMQKGS